MSQRRHFRAGFSINRLKNMKIILRAGTTLLLIMLAMLVAGCGNSGGTITSDPPENSSQNSPENPDGSQAEGEGSSSSEDENSEPANNNPVSNNPGTDGNSSQNNQDTNTYTPSSPVTPATATGADLSGGEDDSPTATESLSIQGPFIRDESRSARPPSIPTGLTHLLSAENWIKMTWAPASDDQSVEGYEIYRDGTLLDTIRGDSGYEFDYRNWLSTSFTDCDYTHYSECAGKQPVTGQSYAYSVVAVDNQGMKSQPSEAIVLSTTLQQDSAVDLSKYNLVFEDEFRGSSLDRALWKTALPWGENETINSEQQYFVNIFGSSPLLSYDPFIFTGETLQITGIATPPELLSQANNQPYLSGVLTTSDHFQMTYGYVEMRAKVAAGQGLLTTFYLFNQDFEKSKPEIDILEYIGSRPDKAYQTYHYYDSNRARSAAGEKQSSPTMEHSGNIDYSADFHRYGVLWEKDLVVWYIDGQEIRRIAGVRVSDEPMNIIAQLVMGSEWIESPDPANIPAKVDIDYVKAWQPKQP